MKYMQKRNYENQQKYIFSGCGKYDIPQVSSFNEDIRNCKWISFNYALNEKHPQDKICHFYLDDYQFTRLWANPDKYIKRLKQFKAICSPDFSLYTDFPKALQIYNHFRKQWISAYYQMCGINVIPTVCWADKDSYEFCFDGVPKNSVVTVSDIWCMSNKNTKEKFYDGFYRMIDKIQPSEVWLFTSFPDISRFYTVDKISTDIHMIESAQILRLEEI